MKGGKLKTVSSKVEVQHRVQSPGFYVTDTRSRKVEPLNPSGGVIMLPDITN